MVDSTSHESCISGLTKPCNTTIALVAAALAALRKLYQPGIRYSKAGVLLLNLQNAPPWGQTGENHDGDGKSPSSWGEYAGDDTLDCWQSCPHGAALAHGAHTNN